MAHLGSWVAIAEKVPAGGRDVWRELPNAPLTPSEAIDWHIDTAQRRNSQTGRMELLVWWTPQRAERVAAVRDGAQPAPASKPGRVLAMSRDNLKWTKDEIATLVETYLRGGVDAANAALPGRSPSAIVNKANLMGLHSPVPRGGLGHRRKQA